MIRDLTQHLIDCLNLDAWPRPAAVVDFGISTPSHLGALQYAMRRGRTDEELDAAICNGPALTKLIQVPGNPYGNVVFTTDYDDDDFGDDE